MASTNDLERKTKGALRITRYMWFASLTQIIVSQKLLL